jgi:hypothetical protein
MTMSSSTPSLPPVNPNTPFLQIITTPSTPPGCHLLRFAQFECDLANVRGTLMHCEHVVREFLRCPGKPNEEITEFREPTVKIDWRRRREMAGEKDDSWW